jgi:hypothetical protein
MDSIANETDQSGASDSALIIRHYVEMLRRHIVPNDKLRELAARLYERHSEALDFIFESRPQQGGVLATLASSIEATPGLLVDSQGVNVLRLLPTWAGVLQTIGCDPMLWAGAPGRVNVSLIIGPRHLLTGSPSMRAPKATPSCSLGSSNPWAANGRPSIAEIY